MKKMKLKKVITSSLVVAAMLTIYPIGANAKWKQDSKGWWNTEGSSWSIGWKELDVECAVLFINLSSRMKGDIMKTKFMLIISIVLLAVATFLLWKGNNNTIVEVLVIISMLLNIIRGLINLWNERRLK